MEKYDCPDNGVTEICNNYDVIAIQINGNDKLVTMAENLLKGFYGDNWSLERATELRAIYPNYDDFRDTKYTVHELTDLVIDDE
ncbi:hypothetical protein Barba22A_gp047 [Rheinheimera phage vB_RspM_Barba22A]|uniref:Uncharacterized protein n=45 Tax=Barbavirus TaxID=2733095 RepID=A0A4P8N5E3_9CAUD|nr:hypothetical protein HOV44_gp051 [Rheinheimera phage Barba5S]YP_009822785.1 hypothetical protein HOV45_gp049 [Rheinheimera phage Barba8S]YP_009822924.1 hypothetical protein HOV46_gp047 [Rheinheimera phage vB_RspM_Barba18A]YP_009823203.1 hypothetical protein HOV48_gp047 [Rheinheimera phage Barba21A]QCQ57898.1 hypothetical protein Barba1A_gp047 [Rheinheimera phage vB_RspM_Barba1A]QCQ58034.1 hypothetical protein Barba1S_gp047 [Rheinheimera phage vB_RspM_Barba1S]QCQ58170.1 hypothetical protein